MKITACLPALEKGKQTMHIKKEIALLDLSGGSWKTLSKELSLFCLT
jgi:hypothetical protein